MSGMSETGAVLSPFFSFLTSFAFIFYHFCPYYKLSIFIMFLTQTSFEIFLFFLTWELLCVFFLFFALGGWISFRVETVDISLSLSLTRCTIHAKDYSTELS